MAYHFQSTDPWTQIGNCKSLFARVVHMMEDSPKGAILKGRPHREGGSGRADKVREVAWIYNRNNLLNAYGGVQKPKFVRTSFKYRPKGPLLRLTAQHRKILISDSRDAYNCTIQHMHLTCHNCLDRSGINRCHVVCSCQAQCQQSTNSISRKILNSPLDRELHGGCRRYQVLRTEGGQNNL